jgi:hypothetical protein
MLGEVFMSYREWKYSDGSLQREWRDEKVEYHRENGPASICYRSDGSIRTEYFYLNGVQHRELGPAFIFYRADGSIIWEDFYLNGESLGREKKGFWALWDNLTEEQRKNPELLKYLVRFS